MSVLMTSFCSYVAGYGIHYARLKPLFKILPNKRPFKCILKCIDALSTNALLHTCHLIITIFANDGSTQSTIQVFQQLWHIFALAEVMKCSQISPRLVQGKLPKKRTGRRRNSRSWTFVNKLGHATRC